MAMAAERAPRRAWRAAGNPQKFKLDILQNIPEGEEISLFPQRRFHSISAPARTSCARATSARSSSPTSPAPTTKATKRTRSSSASTARRSRTRPQLDEYFTMLEEAKKRDHRKLGKELELFTFDDDVGPGLPLWLPTRHGDHRGTGKAREGNGIRRRLRARPHAASRAGEHVSNQRAPAVLRGVDVSADGLAMNEKSGERDSDRAQRARIRRARLRMEQARTGLRREAWIDEFRAEPRADPSDER